METVRFLLCFLMMSTLSVEKLHRESILCDLHCDTLLRIGKNEDLKTARGHINLPKLKEGGVKCQVFACWVDPKCKNYLKSTLHLIDTFYNQLDKFNGEIQPAKKSGDIENIAKDGKIAAVLGIEGGHTVEGDLAILRTFHKLGIRLLTITWNNSNKIATSCWSKPDRGLLPFGKKVIREMNRLGIVIDVSHASKKTVLDIAKISAHPIVASHSCAYTLREHPRNLSDEEIIAIANTDGVIGINFSSKFLSNKKATVEAIVDHIDYIKKLVGTKHIALGSDFDGIKDPVSGVEDASKFPEITKRLVARGYNEEEIKSILGGNFIRVFNKVCK